MKTNYKNPLSRIASMMVVIAMSFSMMSCNHQGPTYVDEQDVTLTYYDAEFYSNENTYQTFKIKSVGILSDKDDDQLSKSDSVKISSRLITGFEELGYNYAAEGQEADFYLIAALQENTNTVVGGGAWWWGYPGYWGGWGFPYPPMWGGWYPWWSGAYSYQYTVGSMMIDKVDAHSHDLFEEEFKKRLAAFEEENGTATNKDKMEIAGKMAEDGHEVDFRWQGIIQGVLSRNSEYNEERLARGMNEAFEMSPYMDINKTDR
ncbi:DUF4136 domain-containing protein [Persicobacter psychrovividus]|uniref:DUF4136 domain-containing protein n=1 Tax=Persicobacter psychrovividus TaxID=387638 RepID=A0ABN6LE97_9BACT|nr:hypothetical protein PEPS_38030 [Persicobacter psychrovividus]